MLSEIFLFCSLSLLSGLFLIFAAIVLLCSIWILLLAVFPQSSVNFTAMAQIALAPINPLHVSVLALSLKV